MLPILISPTPRRCVDFVAARRIDEQDAEREPILLDESGDIVPGGYLNFLHPWPGETPPPGDGGTRDDYAV
jgi:hypothetical protein